MLRPINYSLAYRCYHPFDNPMRAKPGSVSALCPMEYRNANALCPVGPFGTLQFVEPHKQTVAIVGVFNIYAHQSQCYST